MELAKGLKKYQNLPRDEYFEKNQELGKNLWDSEEIPTVADIADFMRGNEDNPKMLGIFTFLENKDDFVKMATRTNHVYNQDESSAFIRKVMASNNEDISKAGYFYKLLMASADDFVIKETDCKSEGVVYKLDELDEATYNYRIRFSYVTELKNYSRNDFDEFMAKCNKFNLTEVHVRTPLTCAHAPHHGICKRCAGALPGNTTNIGTFTALMVTESATQSALSSMNKGRKENINDMLTLGYTGKTYSWEDIVAWINEIVEKLFNKNVSSRFYEISLLSRVRHDDPNDLNSPLFVASLMRSINYSGNIFGAYIFAPTMKNFERIIKTKHFEDTSLKLQIAMNDYVGQK